jgi:predicted phosphodiesterase
MTVIEQKVESEVKLMMMSDLHIGALHNDYKRIEQDLKRAKDEDALIAINGDIFDMILPGDRKRYRSNNLHPRMYEAGDDMIGESIRWAIEILEPYRDRIIMIGDGNHDDSVARFHHIEPVKQLVIMLNGKNGKIKYGGYHGWIHFTIFRGEDRGHYVINYHHGAGGAAPVTKGAIVFSRANMWIEGADAIWRGHTHTLQAGRDAKIGYNVMARTPESRIKHRTVLTVRTGSYMDTYVGTTSEELLKHGRKDSYGAIQDYGALPKGGVMLHLSSHVPNPKHRNGGAHIVIEDHLTI